MLPLEQPGAFKGQLAFVVPEGHFDLPTTGISQNDGPSTFGGMGRFGGEQVPGRLMFAAGHDQPERLVRSGIEYWESQDAGLALATMAGIPQQTLVPRERWPLLISPGLRN